MTVAPTTVCVAGDSADTDDEVEDTDDDVGDPCERVSSRSGSSADFPKR